MTDPTANSVAKPYLDDRDVQLYQGDAITVLQGLPAGIAQTCVTSPPYWGLRDYGTGTWTGGDEACDHLGEPFRTEAQINANCGTGTDVKNAVDRQPMGQTCSKCGAQRVDSQLGLEATPDQYVERMVAVFREVRRVLRDDGTLWLNLGDTYVSNGFWPDAPSNRDPQGDSMTRKQPSMAQRGKQVTRAPGLKPKDLVGIPWRVAFALQADGWYLRSDCIWSKPNPMPESVTDRPTKSHEYLFLFSKQPRYFYDADAIREDVTGNTHSRGTKKSPPKSLVHEDSQAKVKNNRSFMEATWDTVTARNRRSVWTIPTEPFPEAHFATYPQALVTPCILAGTSERGGCVECGAPWRRQTEKATEPTQRVHNGVYDASSGFGKSGWLPGKQTVETTGWEPSCTCIDPNTDLAAGTPLTSPQLVLDPFIGSGTTALVARKHGRRCIGIDLSAEYLAIAAKRTQQLSLLGGVA